MPEKKEVLIEDTRMNIKHEMTPTENMSMDTRREITSIDDHSIIKKIEMDSTEEPLKQL